MKSLTGKRFIVTRPADRGHPLCDKIVASGGEALSMPMVEIIKRSQSYQSSQSTGPNISYNSIFIFTSVYSVELAEFDWQKLVGSAVFAIGPSTSAALAQKGITAETPDSFNSEGMVELLKNRLKTLALQTVVLVKGYGGRELITQWCLSNGISCVEKIIYQRKPTTDTPTILSQWITEQDRYPLYVICTSVEAVELWQKRLLDAKIDKVNQPALIICSERMVEAANELSMPIFAVAETCHNDALFAAVVGSNVTR